MPSIRQEKLETGGHKEMFFSASVIKKIQSLGTDWGGRGKYSSDISESIKKVKHFYFLEHKRITAGKVAAQ